MSDRELLELAAKAAGLRINQAFQAQRDAVSDPAKASLWIDDGSTAWNPLTDDGHALRLAVKLSIGIRSHGPDHWNQPNSSVALYDVGEFGGGRVQVRHGDDQSASTRRAIVLAAAKIGESMQEKH